LEPVGEQDVELVWEPSLEQGLELVRMEPTLEFLELAGDLVGAAIGDRGAGVQHGVGAGIGDSDMPHEQGAANSEFQAVAANGNIANEERKPPPC
jgi:hypothetical protein